MVDSSVSWEPRLAAAEARIEELAEGLAEAGSVNGTLAATNERLRRVVQDAAERHESELGAARAEADRARRRVVGLELEVAELRRRLSMDSTNSSVPPSKESVGAKEKRKAQRRRASERVRSTDRKPGGQPGHPGAGLAREETPDRSLSVDPPSECSSCQADLSGAEVLADGWAQVWDLLDPVLEKVEWVLPRRRCACCRKVTAGAVPGVRHAAAGSCAVLI